MSNYYTGIGSRQITDDEYYYIREIAAWLHSQGWILRSGNAEGSDLAFEESHTPETCEIYLPWKKSSAVGPQYIVPNFCKEQFEMVKQLHPAPQYLTSTTMKLHGRNMNQVVGSDFLNPIPSKFLICCAPPLPGGRVSGGTGTAVSFAHYLGIQVYNIRVPPDLDLLLKKVRS